MLKLRPRPVTSHTITMLQTQILLSAKWTLVLDFAVICHV